MVSIQSFKGLNEDRQPPGNQEFCQQTGFALELQHQLLPESPASTLQILDLPACTVS